MDPSVGERVEYSLKELTGNDWENAWHSLVEMGPGALPYIIQAFEQGCDRSVALNLILVVNECRTSAALPFLASLLLNTDPGIWKAALDGIVTIGGTAAAECLRGISETLDAEILPWIQEALAQIKESDN